ncbi:MAG: Nuclear transport factor 2, partial [Cyphobasidiales sp. Tagirdzhanova-0007]
MSGHPSSSHHPSTRTHSFVHSMQFCDFYYSTFDADRSNLAALYREQSMLSFEAEQFQGTKAITDKLLALPFQKVQHKISTLDAQPSSPTVASIIVLVTGQILVDGGENALSYSQSFQLIPEANTYFVFNDVFRLVYVCCVLAFLGCRRLTIIGLRMFRDEKIANPQATQFDLWVYYGVLELRIRSHALGRDLWSAWTDSTQCQPISRTSYDDEDLMDESSGGGGGGGKIQLAGGVYPVRCHPRILRAALLDERAEILAVATTINRTLQVYLERILSQSQFAYIFRFAVFTKLRMQEIFRTAAAILTPAKTLAGPHDRKRLKGIVLDRCLHHLKPIASVATDEDILARLRGLPTDLLRRASTCR